MTISEIENLLNDPRSLDVLCAQADGIKRKHHGDEIHLRAVIEFSNFCQGTCRYCGLNRDRQSLRRYRLTEQEILEASRKAASKGCKTIVLQSGQSQALDVESLAVTISMIKDELDIAVTLCCGEWSRDVYELWKKAGADRYLLKFETSDPKLYAELHPGMSHRNRMRCLRNLFELGYEVGSGNIVGLPGQTSHHLAKDLMHLVANPYDMIAIGPFIPACGTDFARSERPSVDLVIKLIALARIFAPKAHIPSTTALCSIAPEARRKALKSGANVIMFNFTPHEYALDYNIYTKAECNYHKKCWNCLMKAIDEAGLTISSGFGKGLRSRKEGHGVAEFNSEISK
jgi:biotin synthase